MAQKIIPCGGWYVDDETLTFNNGVLSASGGTTIPVLDMGTVSSEPPVELPITPEQIALAQQENAVVKITYQGITLQLQKIGQSATQVVFSGYVSENNIFFFIDVSNTKSTFNIIPTRQVPDVTEVTNGYALVAQDGEAVWGPVGTGNALPLAGGTMQGAINMGNNKITNLPNPDASTDASTKGYVDTTVSGYLKTSGGAITGTVSMSNNKITNVAAPDDDGDAANKQYVDSKVPALATVTTAGIVKEIPNIEQFTNPSSATPQEIADKFNNLIQNLINAGIMVAGT